MCSTLRRLDRAHPAVAGMHVADVEAGSLAREGLPGPSADRRRLLVSSASGLVWSMNCDSWLPPKNSFMAATTGRMLMSVFGVAWSESVIVIRSLTTRSMRSRPIRNWFWISSPLARMRGCPGGRCHRLAAAVVQLDQLADDGGDVVAADDAARRAGSRSPPRGRSIFSRAATSPRALFSL